jgi:hypothetical protein
VKKKINTEEFVSNSHTEQTRTFDYITTNIRSPQTVACYINELVPEYVKKIIRHLGKTGATM